MKILVQRVSQASITINDAIHSSIHQGVLVFLGIKSGDGEQEVKWLANKLVNLRLFNDHEGKINLSLLDIKGEALIVSQFTLYGDCTAGRRPSFIHSATPAIAKPLYDLFITEVKKYNVVTESGVFGADMKVSLTNDGPVTLIIEK